MLGIGASERRSGGRGALPGYVPPRALYIHVPICASKCAYCDFYSLPSSALPERLEATLVRVTLARASSLAKRFGSTRFDTVYVGGGTPTMLSPPSLELLLGGLAAIAGLRPGRGLFEWTVEANPDSLDGEKLGIMLAQGVTRLSLGVQSLDADELKLLSRRHDPEKALAAAHLASASGLKVSADLIAGVPRPRLEAPRKALRNAGRKAPGRALARYALELLDAGASHLSVYDLCLEEGTPLAAAKGGLDFPSEDEDWESRQTLEAALRSRGLRRYEVSNYAAPGAECRHNLAYWRMDSYIGAGPGAVSTIAARDGSSLRIEEPKDAARYEQLVLAAEREESPGFETGIGLRESVFETIMMSFRTSFGLDLEAFTARFGLDAEALIAESLGAWESHIVPGEARPGAAAPREGRPNPALDGSGLDLLNRFLGDCLGELERKMPS
jgi:oxygen-independent coproporphyrinogen III oxidase